MPNRNVVGLGHKRAVAAESARERELKRLRAAVTVKGHHLRKLHAARKATQTAKERKESMIAAMEMCEALLDYAEDLEVRLRDSEQRMKEFETLQRVVSELRRETRSRHVPEVIIFGTRPVHQRYWKRNSNTSDPDART